MITLNHKVTKIIRRTCVVAITALVVDVAVFLLLFWMKYYVNTGILPKKEAPNMIDVYMSVHSVVFDVVITIVVILGCVLLIILGLERLYKKFW